MPPASLQILTPNGSETWRRGETRAITWSVTGYSGNLIIELLQNNVVVGTIATDLPATPKSYSWKVGRLSNATWVGGGNLKIRIRNLNNSIKAEMSLRKK